MAPACNSSVCYPTVRATGGRYVRNVPVCMCGACFASSQGGEDLDLYTGQAILNAKLSKLFSKSIFHRHQHHSSARLPQTGTQLPVADRSPRFSKEPLLEDSSSETNNVRNI